MNNLYPPWWDKTITIYNKRVDPNTRQTSWTRQTVKNCFWKYVNYLTFLSGTSISLDTKDVICRIPMDKRYVENYVFNELADVSNRFTLNTGDIIVLGEVTDEIDDYVKGQRASDLIAKYKKLQGCIEIESFTIDTGISRCCEHYLVNGA